MRHKKPEDVQSLQPPQQEASVAIEDVPFCIPAESIFGAGCQWSHERQCCFKNNCDALFTPCDLRQQQKQWPTDQQPKLIIAAGPERSGSTWLYNCIRLLFNHAEKPLDCYYLQEVNDEALNDRNVGQAYTHNVLVKTHQWSGDTFDISRATHVIVTHRDLRQVLASYRRMQWELSLPESYVEDHLKWKEHAELDIAFEDIIRQPATVITQLAERFGLLDRVNVKAVLHEVSNLPVPKDWVDPVTQIWPSHISVYYNEARQRAAAADNGEDLFDAMDEGMVPGTPTENDNDELKRRFFPEFYRVYSNYSF